MLIHMLHKITKIQDHPLVFIAKPARLMAILQLCIAFSALLFYLSQPFMGQLFEAKSRLLLWDFVLDHPQRGTLSSSDARKLESARASAQAKIAMPFTQRAGKSLEILAFGIPPFEQAWLLLSLIVPILLLKRVEGARAALWLIPLCVLCYAMSNRIGGVDPSPSPDHHLYPTESYLAEHILHEPIQGSLVEQQNLLKKGWESYLINEWLEERPSVDPEVYSLQLAKGEWAFQHARAMSFIDATHSTQPTRQSLWLLGLFIFWNTLFAGVCFKNTGWEE